MLRVFTNGSEDLGSGRRSSSSNDSKVVLNSSLLNTQHYKVRKKSKKSDGEALIMLELWEKRSTSSLPCSTLARSNST